MKNVFNILFVIAIIIFSVTQTYAQRGPVYKPEQILRKRSVHNKEYDNVYNYINYYLRLSENFTAYDTANKVITKGEFLKTIAGGGYLPLWLKSDDSLLYYKLYKFSPDIDANSRLVFKQLGQEYYELYKREGERFPDFNYVDLKGNNYSSENTKGKILVFDCWFVACSPCVAGIPALNKMAQEYKNRKDILFISLDNDQKWNVENFLKKTRFDFAVVPLPESYFSSDLKVTSFPTTFLVNKAGIIIKVVDKPKELAIALKKEAAQQ